MLDGAARIDRHRPAIARGHWLKIHPELLDSLNQATIFGARISDTFTKVGFANGITSVHVVTLVLILAMTATLFVTQLQLMRKNMPAEALEGPFAQQQKIMLYLFPLIFAIGGINFPVGVLIYWFTSNLWTMGQQFYVIRRNPAPGTPAYAAWEERRQRDHGKEPARDGDASAVASQRQRQHRGRGERATRVDPPAAAQADQVPAQDLTQTIPAPPDADDVARAPDQTGARTVARSRGSPTGPRPGGKVP